MCAFYPGLWNWGLREVSGQRREREMWSGLGTFGCDVAGEPWQTDLSLSSKVSLVVSLVNGFCVAVFLGFRDLLFSEAHVMNCSQSGPLLDLIGKCFQSVWSTVEKEEKQMKKDFVSGTF